MLKQTLFLIFLFGFSNLLGQCEINTSPSMKSNAKNVFGEALECCCTDPMTGYFRDGYCHTNAQDFGTHIVCAEVTDAFLEYSKNLGNDLITPRPEYHFPGLKAGDNWCLCISRWLEAKDAGVAPPINLNATEISALKYITLKELKTYAIAND